MSHRILLHLGPLHSGLPDVGAPVSLAITGGLGLLCVVAGVLLIAFRR